MVCELCTPRAVHEGWIREGLDDATRPCARRSRRRRSLLGRLRAPARRGDELPRPRREPARRSPATTTRRRRRPRRAAASPTPSRATAEPATSRRASRAHVHARPDERRPEGRARARALQRQPAPAHDRRRRALARRADRQRAPVGDRGQRSSRSSSPGSCPGTATRSTSPTRPPACASTARAPSSSELEDGRPARPTRPSDEQRRVAPGVVQPALAFRRHDLLRRPRGARPRALREARALLRGRPNVKVIIDRRKAERRGPRDGRARRAASRAIRRRRPPRPGRVPAARRPRRPRRVKLVVHVDGGARGNPGPAAAAAVVSTPDGEVVDEADRGLGDATNNVAEYRGAAARAAPRARAGRRPRSRSSTTPSSSPSRSTASTRSSTPT